MHGTILWPKPEISIIQPNIESSPARAQGQDQLPSSPVLKERSMSVESTPVDDRDPSVSPPRPAPPPPPPVVRKQSKRRAPPPPPPPPPKKQKKTKVMKPPPKLAYEKTDEELDAAVQAELDAQIFKKKKPVVEKPTDMIKFH